MNLSATIKSYTIALDVRVLIWYAGKKKAVQAESGVEI